MIVEMGADIALHGTHDVVLRLFRMCRRNQPVHEAADARRHAVDDTARIDEFVEQGARCGNALANLRRQLDPAVGILRGSRDRIDGQATVRLWPSGIMVGRVRLRAPGIMADLLSAQFRVKTAYAALGEKCFLLSPDID
jgi:hypothetical protein